MNINDIKEDIERIDQLIRLKATGTPKEFAGKLNTTERTIYRIVKQLKEMGCPIYFDRNSGSYCYEFEGKIVFKFESMSIDRNTLKKIIGGGCDNSIIYFHTDNTCQW